MEKKKVKSVVRATTPKKTIQSTPTKKEKAPKTIPSLEVHPKVQTAENWNRMIMKSKSTKKS